MKKLLLLVCFGCWTFAGFGQKELPLSYSLKEYTPVPTNQGSNSNVVDYALYYSCLATQYAKKQEIKDKVVIKNIARKIFDDMQESSDKGQKFLDVLEKAVQKNEYSYGEYTPFKISSYKKLELAEDGKSKIKYLKNILLSGKPVMVGMQIYKSFFTAKGTWKGTENNDALRGHHAMTIIGYNDNTQTFELMNSWGTDWGNEGYINVKYDDLIKLDNSYFTVEVKLSKPTYNLIWLTPNPDETNNKNYESQQLSIKLKAFSSEGNTNLQPEDFKIYINDELQSKKSGEISLSGTTFGSIVQLQKGQNDIKVCIEDNCSKILTTHYTETKPNLHLLAIGTNPPDLDYPQKDAKDFVNAFQTQKNLFANVFVEQLLGDEVTRLSVMEQLQVLNDQYEKGHIRPNDVVMLFISAHGYIETQDDSRFRLQLSDFSLAFYKTRSIAYQEITDALQSINCKKIIFIDACHSGGAKTSPSLINRYIEQLNDTYAGITTITSSSRNQSSYEHLNWKNGAFTEALLEGLKGSADGKGNSGKRDGVITLGELYAYIQTQIPQLVKSICKPTQEPQITRDDLGDLPVFVY